MQWDRFRRRVLLQRTLPFAAAICVAVRAQATEVPVDFNRDIKPILSNICFKCHGPDAKERKGGTKEHGLRLDTQEGAFADYDGMIAIVPGHPEKSELFARLTTDDADDIMPPKKSGKKLTPQEIDAFKRWINQGAKYEKHWSYVKPGRPALPEVADKAWARNPVDNFILARLDKEGLKPQPETDRYSLIRRVTLDVTGLPPTVGEVDQFVSDTSPDAYEKLVDRLLAKPAYGEHWARTWLDLARYADSGGYASDTPRTIWAYRDYVIKAFNDNKPFDQFTVEQLAGDLLPNPTEEQFIATAFHRNTMTNTEGGTTREEFRNAAIIDRVNTTMSVWMGTSFACAQCHDHKYDPLPQKDYFRIFAILNNTEDADRPTEEPVLKFLTSDQKEQRAQWDGEIVALDKKIRTPSPALLAGQAEWEKDFSFNLQWQQLTPEAKKSKAGKAKKNAAADSFYVAGAKDGETSTIEIQPGSEEITALRLEALPPGAVSGKGRKKQPLTNGKMVVSSISASLVPPESNRPVGRFVRIELPGKRMQLSLAEVQVFNGAENIALRGVASQVSDALGGVAVRAIDGNTDGDFNNGSSTTHTEVAKDPWWEVDLKSAQPIDRVAVWNRTDGDKGAVLVNFRVIILDENRKTVWQNVVKEAPKPDVTLETNAPLPIPLVSAYSDSAEHFEDVSTVLGGKGDNQGWSVISPDEAARPLTLLAATPAKVIPGSKLVIKLGHPSTEAGRAAGHFHLATSSDPHAVELAHIPVNVLATLSTASGKRDAAQNEKLTEFYLQNISPETKADRDKLAGLKKQVAGMKPMTVPVMHELAADKQRKTNIQLRGNYLSLGDEVTAGVPGVFSPLAPNVPVNRLTFAKWLVDENNPLTARVIANRYWEQIFGIGIVRTSEEFGAQGEPPSHPELLDWLATELVGQKWDMKKFVKLLVTSAAYRQSSLVTPELAEKDPDNRLLARGPRFRMSAEMVRDQALAISGLLSAKMFGPPVRPPRPSAGLNAAFGGALDWKTSEGDDQHRRALYTEWRRTSPYPSMTTFDAPSREICTLRRVRTNTPLQALVTLNDPVYIEAAQSLARHMAQAGETTADKVRLGFRACMARAPLDAEVERLVKLHDEAKEEFSADPKKAADMATNPIGPVPKDADVTELAAWTTVANVLLNLDETVMKR